MSGYTKIVIILKDADNHADYNRRIMDYLNDRHTTINDNMFSIAIEVVDDKNINDYVASGMESIPAMLVHEDEPYVYGVNSILSALARLEIMESVPAAPPSAPKKSKFITQPSATVSSSMDDGANNAFYDMIMEEMKNDEQEDPDAPSTLKARHQDLPETPLNDRAIEEKTKAYSKIYKDRQRQNSQRKVAPMANPRGNYAAATNTKMDIDSFISKGGYDKGEEMFMRQIAANLG